MFTETFKHDHDRSSMSFITGVGLTPFGRHEGSSSLDLMSGAAELAISDAGLARAEIDGILCGYSTVSPHIMLATVFAEHFGITPSYAHAVQVGGATGLAMAVLAHHLVDAGVVRHMLVVSGENRLTGQSRDASILALAQVGHPAYEVPLGPTIPAYYGLVASRYMHDYGVTQEDLAEFAVLMRQHALAHSGAQFHDAITVADVMASKPVALPLKLLDCCPVSDGGAAFVVSREPTGQDRISVRGCAQAHTHQHVTAAPNLSELGAEIAIARARQAAGIAISDVRYAAVYDSFTITLAMLLEALGLAERGEAAARVRSGHFSRDGAMPLNTHGGLLSYGHCGVGGAMAHLVETHLQMTGRAEQRQVRDASVALLHGDGGVLSSHVSMFLERVR
jgi:acetyl-CoA acetyltransferase